MIAAAALAAACRQGGEAGVELAPAPPPPTYPGAVPAWPPAPATGAIGRGVAPARAEPAPIASTVPWPPVLVDRVWAIPGAPGTPALAAISGELGDRRVVEVVDVDAGTIRWREGIACQAPVVHVTADAIVCGDAQRMVAVDVATGAERWRRELVFTGADGDLVVARDPEASRVVVVDAASGAPVATAAPPEGLSAGEVRRACRHGAGVELWGWRGGELVRIDVAGDAAGPVERLALGDAIVRVDPCGAPPIVELSAGGGPERQVVALARAPLALAGGPVLARGAWRGPGGDRGDVVVATAAGIEARDAALAPVALLAEAQVGRELAARGDRRLVRGAAGAPVLLEADRPVAWLGAPVHADSAALGDAYVLGGGWLAPARTFADRAQRFRLPAPADDAPAIPPIVPRDAPQPPAIRRDLPPETAPAAAPIELPGAGAHGVGLAFVDPADPATVYAMPLEARPDPTTGAGIAALDLRARAWRWHAPDACPPGMPVAVAVARDVIVCGARASQAGTGAVRAISRDGAAVLWTWRGATVDAVDAAGGLVVVTVGRRAVLLDAATGHALGEIASDDGFAPRAVPVAIGGTDAIVVAERGAVTARLPRAGLLPVWSVAARGRVVALGRAAGRVTAEVAGGELYLLDPARGAAVAAGGWADRWRPVGGSDLVIAEPRIPAGEAWTGHAYDADGAPRFAAELAVEAPWLVGARGHHPDAALPLVYGAGARSVALVDPRTGEARARFTLPSRAVPGAAFATVVDGAPVAGMLVERPLGAVLF